jgi:hypothetical protein
VTTRAGAPGRAAGVEQRAQPGRQHEVSDVVDGHGELEAVGRPAHLRVAERHAGVVDEHVEPRRARPHRVGQGAHLGEAGEVGDERLGGPRGRRPGARLRPAAATSSATARARPASRPCTSTVAPRRASSAAVARPMPSVAPVTRTTGPLTGGAPGRPTPGGGDHRVELDLDEHLGVDQPGHDDERGGGPHRRRTARRARAPPPPSARGR